MYYTSLIFTSLITTFTYTRNCNDQIFYNSYNLKCYNFHAHIRLYIPHVNELSTVPHIGDDNKV